MKNYIDEKEALKAIKDGKLIGLEDGKYFVTDEKEIDRIKEISYIEKRKVSIEEGGYGTIEEQLEILSEQGIDAYMGHIKKIKEKWPKSKEEAVIYKKKSKKG